MEGIYETLQLLLENSRANGGIPMVMTLMHPLVHCWMVKMKIYLGPGVLVNGVDAEDGLYKLDSVEWIVCGEPSQNC